MNDVNVNVSKTIDKCPLIDLKINKNTEEGLRITLSSPVNWDFLAQKGQSVFKLGGVPCYRPRQETLRDVNGFFVSDNVYEYNDYPNLNLLLATGIKNGVTFDFGVFPISESKIRNWAVKFKEQVKMIYLTHAKPVYLHVKISTQTVEDEIHV